MSELGKVRHLLTKYCYTPDGQPAPGLEVASQGDPLVPWGWQLDLPPAEFAYYNSGNPPASPYQLYGHGDKLPVADGSLWWVSASHILEDYYAWEPVLREWARVLCIGGYLLINIPDKVRWNAAIQRGQNPNCSHRHEAYPGELTAFVKLFKLPFEVLEDRLTNLDEFDYNILVAMRKVSV